MSKRFFSLILFLCFPLFTALGSTITVKVDPKQFKSALLMESETGTILYHDRQHDKIIPASIVKLMVSLIVLEQLEKGRISLKDRLRISRWVSKIGGHQVYLKEGEVFDLEELMKAVVIGSANDAAAAVAEYIGGDQTGFVDMMNQKAKELNMTNTTYHNPHGLPPGRGQKDNVTTAYDQALLAQEILKYPQYTEWSAVRRDMFRNGTFELLNTNRKLMAKMPNADGLKTGYHSKAGFSVVATAKRGDTRLIAVVMGTRTSAIRTQIASRLLTRGFNDFGYVQLLDKETPIDATVPVTNGKKETISVLAEKGVKVFIKYSDEKQIQKLINLPDTVPAPISLGQVIGNIEYRLNDKVLETVDLLSVEGVEEKNFLDTVMDFFKF